MTPKKTSKKILIGLLSLIFFFSGFAALIYQIVWQRILTLYYGVGTISITLIVSVYMFGLGVGALWGGILAERIRQKILLYFIIELLIGIFGLLSLSFLDFLGRHTSGSNYLLAFLYMFLFLSFPTLLMGITLPLLTKIFNRLIQDFLGTVSFLYFINTLGAALGALCSSYIIVSLFGLDMAIYFAVGINFFLSLLIFIVNFYKGEEQAEPVLAEDLRDPKERLPIFLAYLLVFVTGFLAIAYEIVWFRVMEVILKASPYMFSSVLAVYLLGIAFGSFGMQKFLRKRKDINKKNLFFLLQFLIGFCVQFIFLGYFYLTKLTPLESLTRVSFMHPVHPQPLLFAFPFHSLRERLIHTFVFFDVLIWPSIFVFVPTLFMGASFPLIAWLSLTNPQKEGRTVGTVYFFNILGNIFGGIIAGFILLAYWGTEYTVLFLSSLGILFGFLIISRKNGNAVLKKWGMGLILILFIMNLILFPKKGELYNLIHFASKDKRDKKIYFEEGLEGVVVTFEQGEKVLNNYINGLLHGGRPGYHFYHKTIEAASFANKIENILIIGFGTGSVAEAILKMDEVRSVTVIEINGVLMKNLKKMELFRKVLNDPRINLIIDDGRRFLLRNPEKFDLILMDALRYTTAYSNNIYSREFFELAKHHLTKGGVFMVWQNEAVIMPATLRTVFENVRLYASFCLASHEPFKLNYPRAIKFMSLFDPEERQQIIAVSQMKKGQNAGRFIGIITEPDKMAVINRDLRPISEYYLGWYIRDSKLFKRF